LDELENALSDCEALLERERASGADDALVAAKEAAAARLQALIQRPEALKGSDPEALARRLRAVLEANRYSLKWSSLRAKLGQIGQPKPASAAPDRPRVDLIH
jgi:predicted component of type VI protein secretion system